MVHYCWIDSPVGRLLVAGGKEGLTTLDFGSKQDVGPCPEWKEDRKQFKKVIAQVEAYFAGKRKEFTINLTMEGTPFQIKVWQALHQIPYGTTVSYGQLARKIGKPKASRAIGAACGHNPLSIVTPCHRVIGSSGKLTGFGGGLVIKQALLALERHHL